MVTSAPISVSSLQFALTAMFHILFPTLSIGLATYLLAMEALWVKTRQEGYYRQARYWGRLFALTFGMGVVTGIPLEFAFGTNFAPFSVAAGDFFGHILGFETAMAFMLEAGFLGVMLFGWKRVSPALHLLATFLVWFGATLSAFWILSANSWMQTPGGVVLENGKFVITDWLSAVFTPSFPTRFIHMYLAALETSLFVIGGVSAAFLLAKKHPEFFERSFKIALLSAVLVAPLQVLVGDHSGLIVAKHQPAKLAAMEAHWKTNTQGGASWIILAKPNQAEQKNDWEIAIPNALSLIVTHTLNGRVKGLDQFPLNDQPHVPVVFWGFRVMLAIGMSFAALALVSLYAWKRGWLMERRWLLKAWVAAIPLGFVATEAGWTVAEVGRQPWIVYGLMRSRDAVSALADSTVWASLGGFAVIYALLFVAYLIFARRILTHGPDLTSPVPGGEQGSPARGGGQPSGHVKT